MASDTVTIYIIGAGFAGQMIAEELARKGIFGQVAAFLDDDPEKTGKKINGIPVFGPIANIASLLRVHSRDEALIAMPSASKERIRDIYNILSSAGFSRIKILPGISQVIDGKAHLIQTREIDPLDILGRDPIAISLKESLAYLRDKRVLITGAGGSIGSELARQLLSGGASRLYLLGHGENSIYQIDRELRILQSEGVGEKATIIPVIGDLKDPAYMRFILRKLRADVVFHCAAYKHVPLMEENPVAAIENNVFGTRNLLEAALESSVKRFVLISTDKAVDPVSVYGASKMLCERLVMEASRKVREGQSFMFVRFGNVLGSRGSILPLFMEQIKTGGPLTVTDRETKRYFMTIPEACSLVLKTGGVGENGSSYLLDMGDPIRILDIAEQIIRFSGFEPGRDIGITFIGMRPGERLEEPLWSADEVPEKTPYPMILKLRSAKKAHFNLEELLASLYPVCVYSGENRSAYRDRELLMRLLCDAVPALKEFYGIPEV